MTNVFTDIQNEIELFFDDLNWTYILIYVFVLYGIKQKDEFLWYNQLFDNNETIKPFKVWIAGIVIILTFCLFRGLETGITPSYVSQMIRSWIIVIVFNSIFSRKIQSIDKS